MIGYMMRSREYAILTGRIKIGLSTFLLVVTLYLATMYW